MSVDASEQLDDELENVIRRYTMESDLTVCQVLGVLELVKHRFIQWNETDDDDEDSEDPPKSTPETA